MRHALPVDSRIISRGIQIASKCRCCKESSTESIRHIFLQSDIGRAVWRCFGEIFRLPTVFSSMGRVINRWIPKVGKRSSIGRASIASFSLWEIRVARCAAIFEGTPMNARRICLKVISQVQLISLIHSPIKVSGKLQFHMMGVLGIQNKSIQLKRGRWCQWTRPRSRRYKLNVDGSARNRIIMGGGVVRDDLGRTIAVFLHFYGTGTITTVEIKALSDGINLCSSLGITDLDIERDSRLVVLAVENTHRST